MKITIHLPEGSVEIERKPMDGERFRAVCALVGGAVYAACLVASLAIVGPWALAELVVAIFALLCRAFAD